MSYIELVGFCDAINIKGVKWGRTKTFEKCF